MKTSLSKIFFGILLAAVVAYLGYQVYLFAIPGLETEVTTLYTATDDIMTSGYIVREEQVIEKESDGIYGVNAESGKRIGKDSVLATVYENDEQADLSREIKTLETKIQRMKEADEEFTPGTLELAQLENEIVAAITSVGMNAEIGSGNGAIAAKEELAVLLNRKALLTGSEDSYNQVIAELEAQKAELEQRSAGGVTEQRAPISGYFVDTVDGYETVLTPATVKSLKVEDLKSLEQIKPSSVNRDKVIGKIIPSFSWYFTTIVSKDELGNLDVGSVVKLKFPFAEGATVPASVYYISPEQDGQYVLTLSSDYEVEELAFIRNPNVQIIKKSYEGLKVPESAVKINNDGKQVVYVRTGTVIQERLVEILFAKDNYYIIKYDNTKKNGLLLYDEVVTKGKNLYDGKVV